MKAVNVGVIGLGWVAQVIHLPILMKLPEANVVALCDKERNRARLVGEKFGVRRVFTDVDQFLNQSDIQAVVVCTSTDAHKDVTIAAMKAGKDVLVEKPVARRYDEAVAMAEAAEETRRKLMVGMNLRFRPDTMILKSFIEGKELGKIFYTKVGWLRKKSLDSDWATKKEKSGGGAFIDLGIVALDMAFWMMGFPNVKRVNAVHFSHRTKQVEDTSLVTLGMKNGSAIQIEASWTMTLQEDIYYGHIFGTEGTASLNPLRINKELHGSIVNLAPAKMDSPQVLYKRSYENELKHFIGAVQELHPVISTVTEAVQRMRIVDAVYKSAKMEKEVLIST